MKKCGNQETLEMLDALTAKSTLTEEDAIELGRLIKKGMAARLGVHDMLTQKEEAEPEETIKAHKRGGTVSLDGLKEETP